MPHLVERICLLWGNAECEPYLNGLLLDSRDGARRGLPWEAAQDLMFLAELSMAKRALHASEITGVPFAQMFARCQETAERNGQSANPGLSLAPKDDPWAPGYYSVLFEDPDGIRLEVNHIPGRGLLDAKTS